MGIITPKQCWLEYDGLNIPNGSGINQEETISVLNKFILNKTGLNIKFKFKGYGESVMQDLITVRKEMTVEKIDTVDVSTTEVDKEEETSKKISRK